MRKKCIIYLNHTDNTRASWATTNEHGVLGQTTLHGQLTDLPLLADYEVIVLVPAADVLLTTVQLPKLSRPRLLQALPFALEEQLLADIEDLHFACSEQQTDKPLTVAVVAKEKLATWLQILQTYGLEASMMTSAVFAVPQKEGAWYLLADDEHIIARTGEYAGFGCDKQNISTFLNLKLDETEEKPEQIYYDDYGTEAFAIPHVQTKKLPPQQLIESLARGITPTATINLLQGHYQARKASKHNKKIWQWSAGIAACWVVLAFVFNLLSYGILHGKVMQTEVAINQIYQRNFPHATHVVAPKARMQQKLNALSHQGQNNQVLTWLGYIGKHIAANPAIQLQHLDFRNHVLNLEVKANNISEIDNLTQALTAQNFIVKQQNVAIAGNKTHGNLLISGGAS